MARHPRITANYLIKWCNEKFKELEINDFVVYFKLTEPTLRPTNISAGLVFYGYYSKAFLFQNYRVLLNAFIVWANCITMFMIININYA